MKYTSVVIIFNPNSTGPSKSLAQKLQRTLKQTVPDQKVLLKATEYAGHAEEIAYEHSLKTKKPLIVSSSGDGGYNEVVNGIMRARKEGADATAGLLPAGNANDHYANVHFIDIAEGIKKGMRKEIDLLRISGTSEGKTIERYGHSYAGFGLTPTVAQALNKNKLNVFNQVWIVGKELLSMRSTSLIVNGKKQRYDSVICSNVDKMSKYLKISTPSSVTDGKFEVTSFEKTHRARLLVTLFKTSLFGAHEDESVSRYKVKTVRKTAVQVDGEIIELDASTDVTVRCEKQALPCVL